jgi:hypothetical protein
MNDDEKKTYSFTYRGYTVDIRKSKDAKRFKWRAYINGAKADSAWVSAEAAEEHARAQIVKMPSREAQP